MSPSSRKALAAVALALLAAAFLLATLCLRPGAAFLTDRLSASWIVYAAPAMTRARTGAEIDTVFRRSFDLASAPARAPLRVRAFRRFELTVNGQAVRAEGIPRRSGGESGTDIASRLRAGSNEIVVRVRNDSGPPALWLALDAPGGPIRTDERWEASRAGATWRPAARASEPLPGRSFDPDGISVGAREAFAIGWPRLLALLAIAAASAIAFEARFGGRRSAGRDAGQPLRLAALCAVALWAALFVHNARWACPAGFDADGHLDYVEYVLDKGTLPLAEQGWQTYQPPLYYVAAALLMKAVSVSPAEPGGLVALRLLNLALAAANLLLVAASLRLLFPDRGRLQAIGLALAAFLPALIYVFHYPTNQVLSITLSTATVFLAIRLVRAGSVRVRDVAILGACLGAALLAKFSTLLLVPVVAAVPVARALERRDRSLARGALLGLASLAAAAAVSGWHYGRVWIRYGAPFVGNWERAAGEAWWQDPGYRTVWDYARFGPGLVAPQFSGLSGVWDGLYSTLWGDALCGGVESLPFRPPWSYEMMAVGTVLALLPTLGILLGAVAATARFVRKPEAAQGLILLLALSAIVGLLGMSLVVPYYAQAKAFYGFAALVPLCALGAVGLDLLSGRARWRRAAVSTLLGTWAAVSFATYWIDADGARARTAAGMSWLTLGDETRAEDEFREALAIDPGDKEARLALAELWLVRRVAPRREVEPLLEPDAGGAGSARWHVAVARMWMLDGRPDEAMRHLDRAIALDADAIEAHAMRGDILRARGETEGAISAWREAIGIDPDRPVLHRSLALAYADLGMTEEARRHEAYARRLAAP